MPLRETLDSKLVIVIASPSFTKWTVDHQYIEPLMHFVTLSASLCLSLYLVCGMRLKGLIAMRRLTKEGEEKIT